MNGWANNLVVDKEQQGEQKDSLGGLLVGQLVGREDRLTGPVQGEAVSVQLTEMADLIRETAEGELKQLREALERETALRSESDKNRNVAEGAPVIEEIEQMLR